MTLPEVPASYREAHRYDGAAVEHGRRVAIEPRALQPRDVAIVRDAFRYKFLTAPQLRELHWPMASVQAADRRLLQLFRAGLLERFRPYARRGAGSFPWTYHVGERGHRLLRDAGLIDDGLRFRQRLVFDYGHVLHEIQLNAWVLAYRRALGAAFLNWEGETNLQPPASRSSQPDEDDWSVEGLQPGRHRPVRPDAAIEISGDGPSEPSRLLLIEYDRTRRLDKNFDKFLRYDAFLVSWWRDSSLRHCVAPPFVVFVCHDIEQRDRFVDAADRELRCHRWHPDVPVEEHDYVGRRRVLFAAERDAHEDRPLALRVPAFPPSHPLRQGQPRPVRVGPPDVLTGQPPVVV